MVDLGINAKCFECRFQKPKDDSPMCFCYLLNQEVYKNSIMCRNGEREGDSW